VRTLGLTANASDHLRLTQARAVAYLKSRTNRTPFGNEAMLLIMLIDATLITWTMVEKILRKQIF
jgi:hypothetical protein